MIDENLQWNICIWIIYIYYFGISTYITAFVSTRIARLYSACIQSRIVCGIEVFGDCAKEYLNRINTYNFVNIWCTNSSYWFIASATAILTLQTNVCTKKIEPVFQNVSERACSIYFSHCCHVSMVTHQWLNAISMIHKTHLLHIYCCTN